MFDGGFAYNHLYMVNKLSTDPYKGTRDFYPKDMAIQRYMFDTWAKTAESFGFERYDASILEPSELYKSKGAENEEMVNEQTYTFTDRGDREVTLRPEMTPTLARMIAGKRRELSFPVRWYSIPNLFRYERPQRGRLREHWQLNCDIFGVDDISADIEMVALAYHTLIAFGATPEMFEIRINSRALMQKWYTSLGLSDESIPAVTHIIDRKNKVSSDEFRTMLVEVISSPGAIDALIDGLSKTSPNELIPDTQLTQIIENLHSLGITNVIFDASISRGFDYYTGTIFEFFDTDQKNNRSLLGGGRYDNLTSLFEGESISGIGFGMGDVTMRDFLETHNLLEGHIPSSTPSLMIIPTDGEKNIESLRIADMFRQSGATVAVNTGSKKLAKKIGDASETGISYIIVVGDTEVTSQVFTLKNLKTSEEKTGTLTELITNLQ